MIKGFLLELFHAMKGETRRLKRVSVPCLLPPLRGHALEKYGVVYYTDTGLTQASSWARIATLLVDILNRKISPAVAPSQLTVPQIRCKEGKLDDGKRSSSTNASERKTVKQVASLKLRCLA